VHHERARDYRREDGAHGIGRAGLHAFELGAEPGPKAEITTLYARMLLAVTAQRRERDARLMTGSAISASIAHEVNQPLSAMIFTPLFTTKSHGMGMGLSICRSIIEAHEGKLWATPKRPHGAVFQFVLPAESVRHDG
jgi:signal transduction histidine kinase